MRSKFKWIFALLIAFTFQFSFSQQRTVTGVVSDETGPLPSANVVVKGTNRGVQTDFDGMYTIQVNTGEVLEISYVGYRTQDVTVSTSGTINVTLSSDSQLDEVIVTAYGTQTRASVAGSVGEIKAAEIATITSANVLQGISGKVAGVQVFNNSGMPGDPPVIRMRGIGSIGAGAEPLYVVDGVPFNGDIASLNTMDIESMTFLKDASAAALYGNRGANGVIIITTKRGKQGKVAVTVDSRSGFSTRAVKEYDIIEGAAEYYEAYFQTVKNSYLFGGTGMDAVSAANAAAAGLITGEFGLNYNAFDTPNDQLIDPVTGQFTGGNLKYNEDWKDYLFKGGFFTQSNFSVSGADEKTNYYFSASHDKNEGYVVNSGFERVTARARIESQVIDAIRVGMNMSYSTFTQNLLDGYTDDGTYSSPFSWTRSIAPIYPVYLYDNAGNPVMSPTGAHLFDDGTGFPGRTDVPVRPYGAIQHPYATAINDIWKYKNNNVFASGFVEARLFEGLTFTYTATADFNVVTNRHMDTPLYGDAVSVNGRVNYRSTNTEALTQQQLLRYNKVIGDHTFDVLAGHETLERRSDGVYVERQNLLIADGIVDHGTVHTLGEGGGNYGSSGYYNLEGFFARLNYDYDNRYYINASIRRDGSSRFHPDNRWGNFYGVGVAWRVSRESFMENVDWLNELRIKASYGEQGNDAISNFLYTNLYTIIPNNNVDDPLNIVSLSTRGNKDITWETNINMNVGFDLSVFDNRLNIEAEYFERNVEDMLFSRPLSPSTGFTSTPENIGNMTNKGVEVSLSGDVIRGSDLTVSLNLNATHYKNEITKLPSNGQTNNRIVSGSFALEEGGGRYDYYLRDFAGVNPNNGAALFWANDGEDESEGQRQFLTEDLAEAELYNIGKSAIPDVYGGFGATARYKWIDLSIQFAYQMGGYSRDNVWAGALYPGERGQNVHRDIKNTWTVDNPNATLPRAEVGDPQSYYGASTLSLISSDYLSLQNISVGYTFASSVTERLGLSGLRIYGLVDNVYLWSKRQGFDPRIGGVTGASSNNYSMLRTTSLGVNLQF